MAKLSVFFVSCIFSSATAFVPISSNGCGFSQQQKISTRAAAVEEADSKTASPFFASTEESVEVDTRSPYEKFGLPEDKVALGVNMTDVLLWLGTREDMVQKAMDDVDKFDRQKAGDEIDKYMMDAEMVNLYIEYKKRKAENPDMVIPPEEEEGPFNFRNFLILYIVYVAGETLYKKYEESQAPVVEGIADAAAAVSAAVDAPAAALESVATATILENFAVVGGAIDAVTTTPSF